ncbi:MAG: RHS repeat domain-containing protein [Kiritimatiellia bacterium]|jgi:RHS repeat-associated protein
MKTNRTVLSRTVSRDPYRRSLVKAITNSASGVPYNPLAYTYDLLNRVTSRNADTFDYNARSEVTSVIIQTNHAYRYAFDNIGNALWTSLNSVTNIYTANELNQYTGISNGTVIEPEYDLDGNMTWDGRFSYAYDAENRLVAAYSNGLCVVSNAYDHLSRRVLKYTPTATYTCIYDGWNLVQETIQNQQSATTNHYVWGKDLSGTLQGAGGVGGLLAVSLNGAWYFPFYDNNGNITAYADETGTIVAEYLYDAFGRTISASGLLADAFRHRFSTKYCDYETGLYYYGYRFYAPKLMRWINRDPIEEEGGENLHLFVQNSPLSFWDYLGLWSKDGVLKVLCCKAEKWVVNDCLSKRKVFSFTEIKVSYDKYEKLPGGWRGKYLGKHEYKLNGKNDGNIWIRSALNDEEAASTCLHECEHARMTGKSALEEEIDVRVAEEEFRIRRGMPEKLAGSRKTVHVPGGGVMVIVDKDVIRKWVEAAYTHRDPSSPYIYDNRIDNVTGKIEVSGWKCP